jgi:hypothetical protein
LGQVANRLHVAVTVTIAVTIAIAIAIAITITIAITVAIADPIPGRVRPAGIVGFGHSVDTRGGQRAEQ